MDMTYNLTNFSSPKVANPILAAIQNALKTGPCGVRNGASKSHLSANYAGEIKTPH